MSLIRVSRNPLYATALSVPRRFAQLKQRCRQSPTHNGCTFDGHGCCSCSWMHPHRPSGGACYWLDDDDANRQSVDDSASAAGQLLAAVKRLQSG